MYIHVIFFSQNDVFFSFQFLKRCHLHEINFILTRDIFAKKNTDTDRHILN